MRRSTRKTKEMTREDFERAQERHFRRVEPYFERLQVEWILKDMDRQREAAMGNEANLTHGYKIPCVSITGG